MKDFWEVELEARAGDFSLRVEFRSEATALGLFGDSGAGKSTLVECLCGLRPARGRIRVGGEDWLDGRRSLAPAARRVGWVPQDAALFPHRSVAENLDWGLRPEADRARIIEVLGLGGLLERRPAELSGGERKRVALGRALCAAPRVLLLDEPLAGLDLARGARVLGYLLAVREEFQLPLLHVSHDPAEVLALAGEVVLLDGGRVRARGPARELLGDALALRLLDRLGLENVLRVRAADEVRPGHALRVRSRGGRVLVAPPRGGDGAWRGREALLAVRAEDILLAAEEPRGLSARNCLPGVVHALHETAERVLVEVDAGDRWRAALTRRAVAALALAPGRPVWVVVKTHSMHWLAE